MQALAVQLHGDVEAGLAAERRQHGVGPLALDDRGQHVRRQRLDVGAVGEVGVGHDRRRVGVGEDDAVALLAQHAARLRAGVVELARLADHDRPRADDEDRREVVAARHVRRRPTPGRAGRTARERARRRRARRRAGESPRPASISVGEAVEQVGAVVRAGTGLGVVLHREGVGVGGACSPSQTPSLRLTWVIVGHAAEAVGGDGEVVVLAGDLDRPGRQVLHRVVGAVVAERQLHRLGPERRGRAAGGRGRCRTPARRVPSRSPMISTAPATQAGSPGPVGQEDAVGLAGQRVGGRRRRRHHLDGAEAGEVAQDRALDAEVVGDDATRPSPSPTM